MNKVPLLLSLICFIVYRLTLYFTDNYWLSLAVFIPVIVFLLIIFILRRHLRYKKWFLSSIRLLVESKSHNLEVDLPADLLFEKLLEVIDNSEFQLLDTDEKSLQILCGTSVNFWTWGENIYIHVHQLEEASSIQFVSTTLFGTSFNRNEKNHQSFIASFEDSLTI